MAGAVEIERKFLVDPADLPAALGDGAAVEQGYLAVSDKGVEVRIRRKGGRATLTVKGGAGRSRVETELDLPDRQFDALWPLTAGRRIVKTRVELPLDGGLVAEVDRYGDRLAGLVTVEVEFASEAAAEAFVAPAWFGRELTDDARYKNRALAADGLPRD